MNTLLEVKNLKKYFKTPKGMLHAVDNISFKINEGEILGVVGESGCGKSTLGRTILHLLEPTEGQIFFDNKDCSSVNKQQLKELRKDMQMVFQDPYASLNPRMTVREIIEEPLIIYRTFQSASKQSEYVEKLMSTVGLANRLENCYPHELDGGRRQRIGIARSLALNPRFIVCDEPVSALDVSIQAQILNLMQDLQQDRGLTYMFVTHDLSVVKHISNNIMVMYLGKLVEFASSDQIFAKPAHPYTKALMSAVLTPVLGIKKERNQLRGEISSPINPSPGCRFAPRCPNVREECFTNDPQMIEIDPGHFVSCVLYYSDKIEN